MTKNTLNETVPQIKATFVWLFKVDEKWINWLVWQNEREWTHALSSEYNTLKYLFLFVFIQSNVSLIFSYFRLFWILIQVPVYGKLPNKINLD